MRTLPAALLSLSIALAACGGDDDGTRDAFPEVEEGAWTWIPIEGSRCADGSATGIGVNLARGSSKLVVNYEGGGACFNDVSCLGVAHQDGYDAEDLAAYFATAGAAGLLDRADPDNPVADWNYVHVPYCTGDIHGGNNEDSIGGRKAVGYVNSTLALARLKEEFGDSLDQVLTAGQSAGGFGALYNYGQVRDTFEGVQVDLLDDSGPAASATYVTPCLEQQVRDAWNLDATLPSGCTQCDDGIGGLVEYWSQTYPDARQGYVSSLRDDTIRQFFGFGYPSCENPIIPMAEEQFQAGIEELRDDVVAPLVNAAMFTLDRNEHVWTVGWALDAVVVGDTALGDWLTGLVEHGDGWENVAP